MIDTCQANTMYSQFYSPNILATGSSEIEENSYSVCCSFDPVLLGSHHSQHESDNDIGVSVIDSYTHFVLEFMEGINKTSQVSVQDLVRPLTSTPHRQMRLHLSSSRLTIPL